MAFFSKFGNTLRQTSSKLIGSEFSASNPSLYQAIRWMSSKLFIGGLSYNTDEQSMREVFAKYGDVIEARIILDRETGRSRGFGFVTYTSTEEASSAIQALDGQDIHGRRVKVNYAEERARPPASNYYGNGGYGGGGGGGGNYNNNYGGNNYASGGYNTGMGNYSVAGGGGGGGINDSNNFAHSGFDGNGNGNNVSSGSNLGSFGNDGSYGGVNTYGNGNSAGYNTGFANYGVAGGGGGSEGNSSINNFAGGGSNGLGSESQFGGHRSSNVGDGAGGFNQDDPSEGNFRDDEPSDGFAKRAS